jgi:hypothetical protein
VAARVVTTWNATGDAEGSGRWQLYCQEQLLNVRSAVGKHPLLLR